VRAEAGEVLTVKPDGLRRTKDGAFRWQQAEVVKLLPEGEASTEEELGKLAGKRK
jgi:hypothetical protein